MTDADAVVARMSRAARPTLFDAACEPELLFSLVLSNLMSPSLWALRESIAPARAPGGEGAGVDTQRRVMEAIQRYVNEHFFHLLPLDIEDVWGLVDLDDERRRLDRKSVDDALAVIAEEIRSRQAHGEAIDRIDVIPLIAQGTFPEYTYGTLDLLRAERAILGRRKHKPLGITCCADEAILIASLAVVLHRMPIDDLVILGSVAHYTAFLRRDDCPAWFNGKREFFLAESWAREVAGTAEGTGQAAFDARLVSFDRILTPLGTWLLRDGTSTIEPARLAAIEAALTGFFGGRLAQLGDARAAPVPRPPGPLEGLSFADLDGEEGAETVSARLRAMAAAHPGSLAEAALYSFRDLDVRDPQAYVVAALRGHKARRAAREVHRFEDAVAMVRAIAGNEPILGTRARIALPDEVLTLGTGSDRDKALLLYTLLRHAPAIGATDARDAEILFTAEDSFVRAGGACVSTRSFEPREPPAGEEARQLAEKSV